METLIKNATIVTQNNLREIIIGDILIGDDRIVEVSGSSDVKADMIIDASGKIAIPGLINSHTHLAMSILRGYGEDLPLQEWLTKKIYPIEAKETEQDAGAAAMLAFCEMIRSGTTCFNDMSVIGPAQIKAAAEKIGIRGLVSQGLFDLVPGRDTKGQIKLMEKTVYQDSSLVKSAIAPHAPYTCSEELLVKAKAFAKKKSLKFHFHASETRVEVLDLMKAQKKAPIEYLECIGILDSDSMLAHASWVSKREIATAGAKGITICHCPISNLKLATGGICPVSEYDSAGANVTLGTDSVASNNSLNMFESMKFCSLLQKHKYWKAEALGAQRALDFATVNGASALGWDCGSIEPGKLADIVLLERGPNMVPDYNLVGNIVYSAGPQNVSDVLINGKVIMKDRKIISVDEKEVIERARIAAENLINR